MTDAARQRLSIGLVLGGLVAVLATVIDVGTRNDDDCPDEEATACAAHALQAPDPR